MLQHFIKHTGYMEKQAGLLDPLVAFGHATAPLRAGISSAARTFTTNVKDTAHKAFIPSRESLARKSKVADYNNRRNSMTFEERQRLDRKRKLANKMYAKTQPMPLAKKIGIGVGVGGAGLSIGAVGLAKSYNQPYSPTGY